MKTAFVLTGEYRDRSVIDSIPASQHPDLVVETRGEPLARGALEA